MSMGYTEATEFLENAAKVGSTDFKKMADAYNSGASSGNKLVEETRANLYGPNGSHYKARTAESNY
jgi:hypothetical protein